MKPEKQRIRVSIAHKHINTIIIAASMIKEIERSFDDLQCPISDELKYKIRACLFTFIEQFQMFWCDNCFICVIGDSNIIGIKDRLYCHRCFHNKYGT